MKRPRYRCVWIMPRPVPAVLAAIFRGVMLAPYPKIERSNGHS